MRDEVIILSKNLETTSDCAFDDSTSLSVVGLMPPCLIEGVEYGGVYFNCSSGLPTSCV